jgi:molecular chaperone DnaK
MKKEAEEHAEEDTKRKEKVEIRNNGDALAHAAQKTLDELKEKISEDDKKGIDEALKELRESLAGDDTDKIKEKTDKLSQALQKASTAIYQQAAQQAAQQQQQAAGDQTKSSDESWSGHPSDDDKTIDADYKVKDDKKKSDEKDD